MQSIDPIGVNFLDTVLDTVKSTYSVPICYQPKSSYQPRSTPARVQRTSLRQLSFRRLPISRPLPGFSFINLRDLIFNLRFHVLNLLSHLSRCRCVNSRDARRERLAGQSKGRNQCGLLHKFYGSHFDFSRKKRNVHVLLSQCPT